MTKKIVLLFAVLLASGKFLHAVPAYPHPITFTQPNGDTLTVRILGDERIHWHESMDGYTLLYDQEGYLTYAQLDENNNLQPSTYIASNIDRRNIVTRSFLNTIEKRLFYSDIQKQVMLKVWEIEDEAPMRSEKAVTGTYKTLCAFVNFQDKTFIKNLSQFDDLMNQLGYTLNGTGSVRDYFRESSYGKFDLEITLCGIYTAPQTEVYYAGSPGDGTLRARELARWAAQQVVAEPAINFADYDSDNNGVVDGFHFIFAGVGQETGCDTCIWSHKWQFTPAVTKNGKSISVYSCSPELYTGTTLTTIGVICHEMTHAFGAPDFYDTNYNEYGDGQYDGTGRWDIMAGGSWNGSPGGNCPPHHNTYNKALFGWVSPILLDSPTTVTDMPNLAANSVAYKISTGNGSEHYLLENRQKIKFDSYIPGNGLIIYHVHKDIGSAGNCINCSHPQMMYPVCASSNVAIPGPGTPASTQYGVINDAGCAFPGTSNKTSFDGTSTPRMFYWNNTVINDKPITEISQNISLKTVSFKFMGGASTFVPVDTIILNTPTAYEGTPLTLSATVEPNDATNQTIVWSIVTAGTTGATISGDVFTATGTGTATVRATIEDGIAVGTDYSQDFKINVLRAGNYDLLVIFISFADVDFSPTLKKDAIDSLFNGKIAGTSLHSYFRDISDDNFLINATFLPGFAADGSVLSYQTADNHLKYELFGTPEDGESLLNDALTYIDNNFTVGHFDKICYVIAGESEEWNYFLWSSGGSYMKIIEDYLKKGTLIHEMYHCIGAPDLYCYPPGSCPITPVGCWDPMETAASHPQSTLTYITQHYGKFIPDIPEITKNGTYTLFDSWDRDVTHPIAYKINAPISVDGEFFVLEYRRKTGGTIYESSNPDEGIIISRINPTVSDGNAHSNGKTNPFGVYVFREDGTYHNNGNLSNACFRDGGLELFSDESNPKAFLSDNKPGLRGIVIDKFSAAGADSMTFRVKFPDSDIWEIGKTDSTKVIAYINDKTLFIEPATSLNWDMKDFGATPDSLPPWYIDYRDLIENVEIKSGVTSIGNYAFYNCTKLTDVIIPEGVTSIGRFAFNYCSTLPLIKIPNSVNSIRQAAFAYCTNLANVNIDPNNNNIGSIGPQTFHSCSSLLSFTIPTGVTIIEESTFRNCTDLASVTILDGVTTIRNDAFRNCASLKTVVIPESVQVFGTGLTSSVFANCTGLTDIYVFWEDCPPAIVPSTFNNVDHPNVNLHIPCPYYFHYTSTDTCASALVWQDFHVVGEAQAIAVSSANPPTFGTVSVIREDSTVGGSGNYPCGEKITAAASANTGYRFVNWTQKDVSGNDSIVSTNANYSFTVIKPRALTAHFVIESYVITLLINPSGTGSSVTGAGTYDFMTGLEVSAIFDNECYTFEGWTEGGTIVSPNPDYFFFVTGPRTLTANFSPIPYQIVLNPEPPTGGTAITSGAYNCGEDITVTAIPDLLNGYEFINWTENGIEIIGAGAAYNFTVAGPRILTAHFALKTYEIASYSNPSIGGTTSCKDTCIYTHGDHVIVTATPNPCYEFVRWTDEFGVEVCPDADYPFIVDGPRILIADFVKKTCLITVVADPPTFGTVAGNGSYSCGNPVTVIATPTLPIYRFINWTRNGVEVSTNATYNFNATDEDCPCTLVANFEEIKYEVITISNPLEGTTTGDGFYTIGSEVIVEAIPIGCYDFVNWTDSNGNEISTNNPFAFFIDKDSTLTANFVLNEFKEYEVISLYNPTEGTVTGAGLHYCETLVTLVATPTSCYNFVNWTDGSGTVFTDNPLTFTIDKNCTFNAHFEAIEYQITTLSDLLKGTTTGDGTYDCGTSATIEAIPTGCYDFTNWTDGNGTVVSSDNPFTFIVAQDSTLTANFVIKTLTVSTPSFPVGSGSTSGYGDYLCGSSVTLTATPISCYNFLYWTDGSGAIISSDNPFTLTLDKDSTLTANFDLFAIVEYEIVTIADPLKGTTTGDGFYFCGDPVTVEAIPSSCYRFVNWTYGSGTVLSTENPFTFFVDKDSTLTANFEVITYNVITSASPLGCTATGEGTFNCGDWVTVEASSTSCYTFVNWTENGIPVSTSAIYGFNIYAHHNLVANFNIVKHNITVSAVPAIGGAVSGGGNHDCGKPTTVLATPDECYHFTGWFENGTPVWNFPNYTFIVEEPRILEAHFERKTFNITTSVNIPGCAITDGDEDDVLCGEVRTVTTTPGIGYIFQNWTLNGAVVSNSPSYTFTVKEDNNLIANYIYVEYDIILIRNPYPGGQADTSGIYPHGFEITVHAKPNPEYVFVNWTEGMDTVSTNPDFTFIVDRDRTLTANFDTAKYTVTTAPEPLPVGFTFPEITTDIPHGTYHTVTATPIEHFIFKYWTINDIWESDQQEYTFRVMKNCHLVAHFKPETFQVLLKKNPPVGGTVDGGGNNLPYGEPITIKATPLFNYEFVNWTYNDGSEFSPNATESFTVLKSDTLTANFTLKKFDILVSADPAVGGTAEENHYNVPYGETVTVYASPNEDYNFLYWTEFGSTTPIHNELDFDIPVTQSMHVVAHFEKKKFDIILLKTPENGGTVSENGYNIPHGTSFTALAEPAAFFSFDGWWEGGVKKHIFPSYTFDVTESRVLTAHFLTVSFPITLSADPPVPIGGTVCCAGDYDYGTTITITATPEECHEFTGWYESDTLVWEFPDFTFTVDGPRHFVAHFTQKILSITTDVSPSGSGYVTVTGTLTDIPCREERTVEAFEEIGYVFQYWTINGVNAGTNNPLTFQVMEISDVVAHFEYVTHDIELDKTPSIGGDVSGGGNFPHGTEITVRAKARIGYKFIYWTENNVIVPDADTAYTFIVENDRLLIAHFDGASFTISTEPQGAGNTTPLYETGITYGDMRTVKATPDDNYKFVHWMENNIPLPAAQATYTFPVTRDRHLVGVFEPKTFNVTVSAEPFYAGEASGGGYNIPYGNTTSVLAKANENYIFVNWTDEKGKIVSDDFQYDFLVTKTTHLTANFIPKQFDVFVSANPNGSGVATGGGTNIPYLQETNVKAKPNQGYVFVGWFEDDGYLNTNDNWTFPVTKNRFLEARFEKEKLSVTLVANPEEGGEVWGGGTDFNYYETVTVHAKPLQYYFFVNWTDETGKILSLDTVYSFNITKPCTLTANFNAITSKITLLSNPPEAGILTGDGDIPQGKPHTISATPDMCYNFINWTENGIEISKNQDYPFIVDENDRTFTANFSVKFVNITVSAAPIEGGLADGGGMNIPCGEMVTVTAEPFENYGFVNWTINGEEVSTLPAYTFKASESCNVVANFALDSFNIIVTANPSNLGTVSGGGKIPYGTQHTVSATPFSGQSFINWTENGIEVSDMADYTFTVTTSRNLVANFEKTLYNVIVISNDTLYGEAHGSGKYALNETATVVASVKTGYQFSGWTVDGIVVSTSNVYEFVVTNDITLVANFYGLEFDEYVVTLWENTFLLDLKKLENEEYDITECKWFKNGKQELFTNTINEFSYSAGPRLKDKLELYPSFYYFQLTTKKGLILYSTKKILRYYKTDETPANKNLFVYPNPAESGQVFTIENTVKGALLQVYNQYGVCVKTLNTMDTTTTLSLDLPAGIYLIRNENKEAKVLITR